MHDVLRTLWAVESVDTEHRERDVGDNDPKDTERPETPVDAPESKGMKLGGSRDLKKFDGPQRREGLG
jgi:hypothetical protein